MIKRCFLCGLGIIAVAALFAFHFMDDIKEMFDKWKEH